MKSARALIIVFIAAIGFSGVALGESLPDGKNIIINFNKNSGITVTRPELATQDYCCTFKSGIKCSANPCSQCNCAGNSVVIEKSSASVERGRWDYYLIHHIIL